MWIMTSNGFISVVELPEPHRISEYTSFELQVRARETEVLEWLVNDLVITNDGYEVVTPIIELPGHDYEYRVYVDRDAFAVWVSRQVQHINYPNFKASVKDALLHHVYNAVWYTIASLYGSKVLDDRPKTSKRRPKRKEAA